MGISYDSMMVKHPFYDDLAKQQLPTPVSVRWADVNKGDDECPDIRSWLVATQIRGANEDPMFVPTPPLEALRTVLSYCDTDLDGRNPNSETADRRTGFSSH